jgi:hypothetical protein
MHTKAVTSPHLYHRSALCRGAQGGYNGYGNRGTTGYGSSYATTSGFNAGGYGTGGGYNGYGTGGQQDWYTQHNRGSRTPKFRCDNPGTGHSLAKFRPDSGHMEAI